MHALPIFSGWALKELRSFLNDYVLLGLVIYTFTVAIMSQSQSNSQELRNASIAIVDEDHSALSRQMRAASAALLQERRSPSGRATSTG